MGRYHYSKKVSLVLAPPLGILIERLYIKNKETVSFVFLMHNKNTNTTMQIQHHNQQVIFI